MFYVTNRQNSYYQMMPFSCTIYTEQKHFTIIQNIFFQNIFCLSLIKSTFSLHFQKKKCNFIFIVFKNVESQRVKSSKFYQPSHRRTHSNEFYFPKPMQKGIRLERKKILFCKKTMTSGKSSIPLN